MVIPASRRRSSAVLRLALFLALLPARSRSLSPVGIKICMEAAVCSLLRALLFVLVIHLLTLIYYTSPLTRVLVFEEGYASSKQHPRSLLTCRGFLYLWRLSFRTSLTPRRCARFLSRARGRSALRLLVRSAQPLRASRIILIRRWSWDTAPAALCIRRSRSTALASCDRVVNWCD